MENFTTEENVREPILSQNLTFDDGNQTTESFPSTDDPYKNSLFTSNEDFQHSGIIQSQNSISTVPIKSKKFNQTDCSSTIKKKIKLRISNFVEDSYEGNLRSAIQAFEKIEKEFLTILPDLGKDGAGSCREVAHLYYRGHIDGKALYWLRKCEYYSNGLKEEDDVEHFRKFYLGMADILIKEGMSQEAEKYLKKAEGIIGEYLEDEEDYDEVRALSWLKALKGHLFSQNGQYKKAEECYKESIELKKRLNNPRLESLAHDYLADFYINNGDLEKAKDVLKEVLEKSREFKVGYYTEARYWRNQGRIAFLEKDEKTSKENYGKALKILEEEFIPGNSLEVQYKKEYKEKFGVDFVENNIGNFSTNSI